MKSFRHSKDRGSIIPAVLCTLMIFGGVGAVLLMSSSARLSAIKALENRLESERVSEAYGKMMNAAALKAARDEMNVLATGFFTFPTQELEVTGNFVDEPFPADALTFPRTTPERSEQDPGSPSMLSWNLRYSEAIRARGHVQVKKESWGSPTATSRSIPSETTLWRIPAGAIRFLSSRQPLTLQGISIYAAGQSVLLGSPTPSGFSSQFLMYDMNGDQITAGGNPGARFDQIYRNTATAGSIEITLDDLTTLPSGFDIVSFGGTKFPALKLGDFFGPTSIRITGTAVANGLFILGTPRMDSPISVAVSAPVYVAGSNSRYAIVATSTNRFGFFSQAVHDVATGEWVVSAGAAVDQTWRGHFFISQPDPILRIEESWLGRNLTINGSLHVVGGRFTVSGSGTGSLNQLSITEPDWSTFPNPFTFAYRHESILSSR